MGNVGLNRLRDAVVVGIVVDGCGPAAHGRHSDGAPEQAMTETDADDHNRRAVFMLAETAAVTLGWATLTAWALGVGAGSGWLALLGVLQGVWFQRLYCVGHEASHRKLFPGWPLANDLAGQLALLPLLVPLRVFRKIHAFHHGMNRRDAHTSSLEVFVVPAGAGPLRRAGCHALWYLAVFAGGWFVHSLVSIVLFLFLPRRWARKVSPAFHGWRRADQLASWGVFAVGLALHGAVVLTQGWTGWAWGLGLPMAVFAWVYSVQLYVYHYDTTLGPRVRFHVRSLRASPLTSWWLLHLDHHAVHHRDPRVPWYALPQHHEPPPVGFEGNHTGVTWLGGVLAQLRGARIVEEA